MRGVAARRPHMPPTMRKLLLMTIAVASTVHAETPVWEYPAAPRGDVVEDYHGVQVADPYRWMEDLDAPRVQAWVQDENALADKFLNSLPERNPFRDRLTALWNFPRFGLPFKEGGHYFFTKNDGLQNQAVLYTQASLEAEPRVLLDPNTLSADGTLALSVTSVSPDGRWLAYGISTAGSDWVEFRVREVDTGQDTSDHIKWTKFSDPSWTKDSAGFFYSRFPAPDEKTANASTFGELANQRLYYHKLGVPQAEDRLIAELPEQPKWFVNGGATEDGRFLLVEYGRGDMPNTQLSVADLLDPQKPVLTAPIEKVIDTWEARNSVIGNTDKTLIVLTDLHAPKRRVVEIDPKKPGQADWKTLIPEGPDTIEHARVIGGKLVLQTMHDASNRLLVYEKDGRPAGSIELPGIGSVSGFTGKEDESELFYSFMSFTYPTSNFRYDLATGKSQVFNRPQMAFNPDDYETKQVFYPSKDGTKIPMFITAKKGVTLNGNNPTLLYGYGGFDIPLTPRFSVLTVAWIEKGGVYALANLRGGGEYGKEWHEAGTKERKQNVFNDFISAAEWLTTQGYTSKEKLAINGGSNGGLLIGAVTNQRPELFAAAIPEVGVMDMLRFHKFTIGYAWVSDYGSSENPSEFAALHAYSPLHSVKAGAHYPAMLLMTGDHDDRVFPAHTFKYTATLQDAVYDGPGAKPVLVSIETRAGHGAGKPISKVIQETANKLAFAAHFTGLEVK